LSVVQQFSADGGPVVDFADTDAASEAQLDALEEQVFFCLHGGPTGSLFRKMVKLPFAEWVSSVQRSGEEAIRIARRTLRGRIRVKESCYDAAPATMPAGLDRLPAGLREIAQALGVSTYLADLARGVAAATPVMPLRVPIDRVGLTLAPQPGVSDTKPIEASADNLDE
ncbi:MAG: hypothetical protein KDJ43_02035, partial [Rhizobiaceae bacterium]|nr:hypothetical protein [Rhizobiaceae bacterium]